MELFAFGHSSTFQRDFNAKLCFLYHKAARRNQTPISFTIKSRLVDDGITYCTLRVYFHPSSIKILSKLKLLKPEWLGPRAQTAARVWEKQTWKSQCVFPTSPLLRVRLCMHRAICKAYQRATATRLRTRNIEIKQCCIIFEFWLKQTRETLVISQHPILTLLKHQKGCVLGERTIT